jgi:hypothetical protein
VLDRKLKELREILIQDLDVAGILACDAEAMVEHNLVGTRKSRRGHVATYASPEAITLLELRQMNPLAPKGWESAQSLNVSKKWRLYLEKSSVPTIGRKLEKLRSTLVGDIIAAGYSPEEATALVEHNLVGHRRGKYRKGTALYASPEALAVLREGGGNWQGKIHPITPGTEEKSKPGQSGRGPD